MKSNKQFTVFVGDYVVYEGSNLAAARAIYNEFIKSGGKEKVSFMVYGRQVPANHVIIVGTSESI